MVRIADVEKSAGRFFLELKNSHAAFLRRRIIRSKIFQPQGVDAMSKPKRTRPGITRDICPYGVHSKTGLHVEQWAFIPDVTDDFLVQRHRRDDHDVDVTLREIGIGPASATLVVT